MKKAEVLWGFGLFAWGLIALQADTPLQLT